MSLYFSIDSTETSEVLKPQTQIPRLLKHTHSTETSEVLKLNEAILKAFGELDSTETSEVLKPLTFHCDTQPDDPFNRNI